MDDPQKPHGGPTTWMRQLVHPWLRPENRQPEQLEVWLQGLDLPAVGDDEEPYVWILRGLPVGTPRHAAEETMACALATLLDTKIDQRTGRDADRLLYNIFLLAAGLSCPDALCEPLHRVMQRESMTGRQWRGIALPSALCTAIIENQGDARYWPVWRSMLKGDEHPYLGGSVTSGFDGTLWMPPDAKRRGEPALAAIGEALRRVAHYLDSTAELQARRSLDFKSFLKRVRSAYPGRTQIQDATLLRIADTHGWPPWAVRTLHSLVCIVGRTDDGKNQVALWKEYGRFLRDRRVEDRMCHDEVIVCALDDEEMRSLGTLVRADEEKRRQTDFEATIPIKSKPQPPPVEITPAPGPILKTKRKNKYDQ